MTAPWLMIDVSCLAYRAAWASLDAPTGWAFLSQVGAARELCCTSRVAWCFDGGCGRRRQIDPSYKAARRQQDNQLQEEVRREVAGFLGGLRPSLRACGFANVFHADGYEADDVIARACDCLPPGERAVVVSSDHDLWQLLRPCRVEQLMPSKHGPATYTAERFRQEWLVQPDRWADALAIAGCDGDGVRGVRGVGLRTAVKYLSGGLRPDSKTLRKIEQHEKLRLDNLRLVRLPLPGLPPVTLREDGPACWVELEKTLGFRQRKGRVVS